MKIFKRLLLTLLILALCIPAYADALPQREFADMNSESAVVLRALGMIKESQKYTDDTVTRSEFANSVIMSVFDSLPKGEQVYDLTVRDGGLYQLLSAGVISGDGDGKIRPNDEITVCEAVKISLSMLGYDERAKADGGYPSGYLKLASRLKLLNGVAQGGSEKLTYSSFINLLQNVIDCEVMELVSYSPLGQSSYKKVSGKTLISAYRNIYSGEGVITATEASGLYSAADKTDADELKIDGTVYNAANVYLANADLLGANVKYYYRDSDAPRRDVLLCAVAADNKILEISSDDIISYDGGRYTYEKDGKKKEVLLPSSVITIYNGVYDADNEVFSPQCGKVVLTDNNSDGKYDVLNIHDVTYTVIQRVLVSEGNLMIFDKYTSECNIVIKDYENTPFKIYDAKGEKREYESIANGNIIAAEISGGAQPYCKMTVCTDTAVGSISAVNSDGAIIIDVEEYKASKRFKELIESGDIEILYNTPCTLYLGKNAEVVYADYPEYDQQPLSYRIGYLHKFAEDGNGLSSGKKVRVLDQGGSWRTYTLAKKINVNGETQKSENVDFSDKLGGLIKYMLNISGELTDVYFSAALPDGTPQYEMNKDFQLILSGNGIRRYYPGGWVIAVGDNFTSVSDKMTVFIKAYSEGELGEEQITVTGPTIMVDTNKSYNIKVYNYTNRPGVADTALITSSEERPAVDRRENRPIAINEIRKAVSDDGEDIYVVVGLQDGIEASVEVRDLRKGNGKLPFKPGDIVYLIPDIGGRVTLRDDAVTANGSVGYSYGVLCGFDENGKPVCHNTTSGELQSGQWGIYFGSNSVANGNRGAVGKVYDVTDSYMYVNCSSDIDDWTKIEPIKTSSAKTVYVYDKNTEKFRVGTVYDAVGYKNDYSGASDVYILSDNKYIVTVIYP